MPDHGCVSWPPIGHSSIVAAAASGLCKQLSEDYGCGPKPAPRLLARRCRPARRRQFTLCNKDFIVVLIAYYVAFMIAGDLAAYTIGLVTELEFGGHVSLIVFLALYFLFLWIAWILAVWLTKPKDAEPQSARSA